MLKALKVIEGLLLLELWLLIKVIKKEEFFVSKIPIK
jgi:hypothetical protein